MSYQVIIPKPVQKQLDDLPDDLFTIHPITAIALFPGYPTWTSQNQKDP